MIKVRDVCTVTVQFRRINQPRGSKTEDLTCNGHVRSIRIATPAFPDGPEATKVVGNHFEANLKEPSERK